MTVKSNLTLDARIKSINDIQSCLRYDDEFIGCKGFFFNDLERTDKLSSRCDYGTLLGVVGPVDDFHFYFRMEYENGRKNFDYFRFFIPEKLLRPVDKKYRAYTTMEFIKDFPLGSHLRFRLKMDKSMEMHRIISGYNDCKSGSGVVFMCGAGFSMSELYDNYDIFKDGEWMPFGVEVEDGE